MTNLINRIEKVLKDHPDLDQVGLAKVAKTSKSVVNQWLSGKIKSMQLEYALNIEQVLGYSHIWLVLGKGKERAESMQLSSKEMEIIRHYRSSPTARILIDGAIKASLSLGGVSSAEPGNDAAI